MADFDEVAEPAEPIRVVLVDDQELVRAGFTMVLDAQPDIEVVGEAGDGVQALELLRTVRADVVLMDVRMPRMDGIEATRLVVARGGPKVVILTTFDLDEYAFAAIKAGAGGFMLKDAGPAQLIEAIKAVHSGDAVVAPSTTKRLLDRFAVHLPDAAEKANGALETLTEREGEVLRLVARGMSNAEIAGRLYVSEATVKTHMGRILMKLGLRDRVQAVVFAYETGLVKSGQSGHNL
ncbi:two component transcriptional regulator, LuxR family [Actinomadura meyerae]|jgi:DNA-binding NarL/FixJ family response regulator|uniref:Two component transcriptional regulator, LuxR family n=1 Tax=Actinomadura meyerae TaxID=240840 RepID=A0A239MV32_9ACTN|nr:response regulator transcription factor [Actinomadura meyerae]SNT46485.1 two component transcriptional regulator, LuxR family [Actinomadura meyerae]